MTRAVCLLAVIMLLLAAGCSGDSDSEPTPIPAALGPASPTRVPPTFPPTWTPEPSLTPPPVVTYEVTAVPTFTPYTIPTYTPFPGTGYPVLTADNAGQLDELRRFDFEALDFAVAADGLLVVGGSDGIRLYPRFNLAEPPTTLPVPGLADDWDAGIVSVAVSPDGTLVAGGNRKGEVQVWETASHSTRYVLPAHVLEVSDLAFSPDGRTLFAASQEPIVRAWDMETGQAVGEFEHSSIQRIAVNAQGTLLAAAGLFGEIMVWNPVTGDTVAGFEADSWTRALSFSPDGALLAYSDGANIVIQFTRTLTGGEPLATLENAGEVQSLVFSPDSTLLAAGLDNQRVVVWEIASRQQVAVLTVEADWAFDSVTALAFSPDGRALLLGVTDYSWRVWGVR